MMIILIVINQLLPPSLHYTARLVWECNATIVMAHEAVNALVRESHMRLSCVRAAFELIRHKCAVSTNVRI